jgi:hypothetical protein
MHPVIGGARPPDLVSLNRVVALSAPLAAAWLASQAPIRV